MLSTDGQTGERKKWILYYPHMTLTAQALLPSRCSGITGHLVKRVVGVLWLGPINSTEGWSYQRVFPTLGIIHE